MSYGRLNLQDFKDVLTAANISHIEDGIINNETKISDLDSLARDMGKSELGNSILPLWHTLLSDGGEKIFPPQFSFNGNLIGKTFLPVNTEDEVSAGYVRLGEDIGMTAAMATYGGCYHVANALLIGNLVDPDKFSQLFFDTNSSLNEFGINNLSLFAIIGQESYDFGDNPVVIYDSPYHEKIRVLFDGLYSNFFGNCSSIDLPSAFSIDRDFEYNGIIYPSGFYGICIYCNYLKNQSSDDSLEGFMMTDLPYFYVNRFWPLMGFNYDGLSFIDTIISQLNAPLDYSKASNAFECAGESIYWNGSDVLKSEIIIPSDHYLSFYKCISHNPQAFLSACLKSTSIELIQDDTVKTLYCNIPDNLGSSIKSLIYTLGSSILIVPTTFQNDTTYIPAGVYVTYNQPFELKFYGVNTEKLFNKYKIDNQYLPQVPEFNLVEKGLAPVALDGTISSIQMDTKKLLCQSQKGPIKLIIPTVLGGEVSYLANFVSYNSANQSVCTVYYYIENSWVKFDILTIFDDNEIAVRAIPVS